MTFDDYQKWVANVACFATGRDRLFLGPMGLNGEAGEVSEILKKHLLHNKALDGRALEEEMGDVLWYFALIMANHGLKLDDIIQRNVLKLVDRHGHEMPAKL